jgi:hypothetical protein
VILPDLRINEKLVTLENREANEAIEKDGG